MAFNPDILKWARLTAGLSLDQAAKELGFLDTHKRSAAQRLASLESGEENPSRSVLLRMAKAYRRSLLVFYLAEPPRPGDRGEDFRTVPGAPPPQYDPIIDALIRDIRGRQSIVRSLMEEIEQPQLDFVGTATMETAPRELANRITETFRFSLDEFRSQADVATAFNYLRERVESSGVFVLLLGNLGSHHTNISAETFRGFAIADPIAPLVVVNDQDAKTAWSFTTLHETVHLFLGTTGISGGNTDARIERYCNDVAGEILLPTSEVKELAHVERLPMDQAIEAVSQFAKVRRISSAMVAYKVFRSHIIDVGTWRAWDHEIRRKWLAAKAQQEEFEQSEGGPSYYVIKRHRLGPALLNLVRHSLGEGAITHTKAAQLLGVRPRNVDPLLHGMPVSGGR